MSRFIRSNFRLKTLADNSFRAINEGAYNAEKYDFSRHSSLCIKKQILTCPHAPLITEIKISSPSRGKIMDSIDNNLVEIAKTMVSAGAISLSVLTQPYLFDGSIDYLAMIRKTINIPLLMKDIIVSDVQIDCAKRIGADCILLIKAMFDNDLTEGSLEKFSEYAAKKGLQVLVEVHSEQEFEDVVSYRRKYYDLIGVNNRDLNNLDVDISTTARLLKKVNKGKNIVVSESGITKAAEIRYLKEAGADCFLIGTSILASASIESKLKELYFSL